MSEDKTLQLPITDEYPQQNPAPSGDGSKWSGWYLIALVFGILSLAGGGFWLGQSLENQALDETLEAVTEAVAEAEQTAVSQNQATGTAIVRSYTATPTVTNAPTLTATPEVPEGVILPLQVELRAYPHEDAPVLLLMPQNTLVMVLGTTSDNEWLEINFYTKNSSIERGFVPAETVSIRGGDLTVLANIPYPTITPSNTPFPSPIPSQTALPTSTPEIPVAEVAGVSVPVYGSALAGSELVDSLNQGHMVEILGVSQDNQWYEISYVDSNDETQQGFVAFNNVVIRGGSLQAVPIAALPTEVVEVAVATPITPQAVSVGMLMLVRSGPDDSFEPVGFVDNETSLTINAIAPNGKWFQVDYPDSPTGLGWISIDHIDIQGSLAYLPIVQGPPLPPPPIEVVIEGNVNVPGTANNPSNNSNTNTTPPPVSTNTTQVVAELPTNFSLQLNDIPGVNTYGFTIGAAIVGEQYGLPYQSTVEINVAEDRVRDQFIYAIRTEGEELTDFGELGDLLPLAVGKTNDTFYVYFGQDDFCFPTDEPTSVEELLGGFSLFSMAAEQLVSDTSELGVFGVIEDAELYGLPVHHYQMLGYPDSSAENGYVLTEDMKVDLWFSPDESSMYAFSFTFNIQEDSDFGQDLINELGFQGIVLDGFEGQIRLFTLPDGFGEGSSIYSEPPAACDLFID